MKSLILLTGLALVAACDRPATPTATEPRAVTGVVEVQLGSAVHRYDLRVDRVPGGFIPALRPIGHAGLAAAQLARLPFVRDSGASGGPIAIQTPAGTVRTSFSYRSLGPWQVLDRTVTSIELRTPQGARTVEFSVALRAPRLER